MYIVREVYAIPLVVVPLEAQQLCGLQGRAAALPLAVFADQGDLTEDLSSSHIILDVRWFIIATIILNYVVI